MVSEKRFETFVFDETRVPLKVPDSLAHSEQDVQRDLDLSKTE